MWVDTHCHLGDPAFAPDRDLVVERMHAAAVGRALVIESDLDRLDDTAAWVATHPSLSLATGCHPHDAARWDDALAARLRELWQGNAISGAGEMGLDYHYDHSPRQVQREVFARQLSLAVECNLPAIIHAREADDDVVAILRNEPRATVVLHSFSSGLALRRAGLAEGWYFSFSGMITFRNWEDVASVRDVAAERLLVETDSPYLAPVPNRGKRNEPANVAIVGRRLAEWRLVDPEEMAALTTANAARVFGDW